MKSLSINVKHVVNNIICGWTHKSKGLLIIRIALGAIFIAHGVQKLQNIEGTTGFFTKLAIPMPAVMAWVVALVETLGGAAMILGIGTGISGILLAIIMVVAIFTAKAGSMGGIWGAEFEWMLLASALGIVLAGPGRYALHDKVCKGDACGTTCNTCNGSGCVSK